MILGFLKSFAIDGTAKPTGFEDSIKAGTKIHTIRIDPKGRWKMGGKIHFANGVRTKNYNCFKEGFVVSIQKIKFKGRRIWVGWHLLDREDIEVLATNDGFSSVYDFWKWFDDYVPFEGVIIHWTPTRY
jgi:hypothetical protein